MESIYLLWILVILISMFWILDYLKTLKITNRSISLSVITVSLLLNLIIVLLYLNQVVILEN